MTELISADSMEWQDHPTEAGVKTKLLALVPDRKLRFRLDRIAEKGLAEHSHPNGHILFVLSGHGTIWIEDAGNLELSAGNLITIPPDLRHSIMDVVEPVEILSIATL